MLMKKNFLKIIDENVNQISFRFNKKIKISTIQTKIEQLF